MALFCRYFFAIMMQHQTSHNRQDLKEILVGVAPYLPSHPSWHQHPPKDENSLNKDAKFTFDMYASFGQGPLTQR
jgi:hypothetical protein